MRVDTIADLSAKINALPVINDRQELVGALNMHDLLRAGVV